MCLLFSVVVVLFALGRVLSVTVSSRNLIAGRGYLPHAGSYTIVYSECTCLLAANVLCVQLSEYFSQLLALTEFLECDFGVALGVTITHNHGNVATYTLSTESSFCEACSH